MRGISDKVLSYFDIARRRRRADTRRRQRDAESLGGGYYVAADPVRERTSTDMRIAQEEIFGPC